MKNNISYLTHIYPKYYDFNVSAIQRILLRYFTLFFEMQ